MSGGILGLMGNPYDEGGGLLGHLPQLQNSHGGSMATGILGGMYSGLTLPRDVYQGTVDLNTDEGTGRVLDMAGTAMTGGLGGAPAGAIGSGPIRSAGQMSADDYIKQIGGKRVADGDRPNLGMGDMYGMAPKGAKPVNKLEVPELGNVRIVEKDGNVYAIAFNPDLGEEDVIGYMMRRGDGSELAVVNEAQGHGIGSELSYQYRKRDPYAPSGGFTEAGEKTARKVFERLRKEGIL